MERMTVHLWIGQRSGLSIAQRVSCFHGMAHNRCQVIKWNGEVIRKRREGLLLLLTRPHRNHTIVYWSIGMSVHLPAGDRCHHCENGAFLFVAFGRSLGSYPILMNCQPLRQRFCNGMYCEIITVDPKYSFPSLCHGIIDASDNRSDVTQL